MRRPWPWILLAGIGFAAWWWCASVGGCRPGGVPRWHFWRDRSADGKMGPQPDHRMYEEMRKSLECWREAIHKRHRAARTAAGREAAEQDARVLLETVLPAMMRCWLGTPWDFNGTANGPGNDPVACGYFVSTVLKDAGFQVDRYRLAQQPSSRILTSFVSKNECRLMVDLPYERFTCEVEAMRPGIYLVGLDTHVAFLVVDDGAFRFIHASGSDPWCVVEEGRDRAEVLRKSRWRMLANLTADSGLLRKWLERETLDVRLR